MKIKRSLKQINIFLFFIVVFALLLFMLLILFYQRGVISEQMVTISEKELIGDVEKHLDHFFEIPELTIGTQVYFLENENLINKDDQALSKYFASVISTLPDYIYSYSYGLENGNYYGARRIDGDKFQFYKSDSSTGGHSYYYKLNSEHEIVEFSHDFGSFDPRTREWYKTALETNELIYSSIYEHFVMKDMTLSAAKQVVVNKKVKGVVGVHLTLSRINEFLRNTTDNSHASIYIINNLSDKLIASTNEAPNFVEIDSESIRAKTINDIEDPYVQQAYENNYKSKSLNENFSKRFRVSSTTYKNRSIDWQIITLIPENQFSEYLMDGIHLIVLVSLLLLSISVIIWSKVTKKMLSPIDDLVEATNQFSQENFKFIIKKSNIVEVNYLSSAFLEMTKRISDSIRELNRINKDLNDAKQNAEEANKSKTLFLANMSHEIRTPMNGIIALTDLLVQEALGDKQMEMVKVINESGKSLLQIINDILDISKIESGKMTYEPSDVDLKSLLNQNVLLFSKLASQKGIAFKWHFSKDLPDYAFVDSSKLNQILFNLLGNAVKFTDRGHVQFDVGLDRIDEEYFSMSILIEDTGIGIKKEDLDTIFDIFVQSDVSKEKKNMGTGLGLAIVREMVHLMHGKIEVASKLEVGTRFFVTLKVGYSSALETQSNSLVPDGKALIKSPHILLVDDDKTSHFVIKIIADKFYWNLTSVSSGLEALEILENESFDLILMDVQMPVMSGLKVTQQVRLNEKDGRDRTIIIGMSAYAMEIDINEAMSSGMDDYITKPIDFIVLKELVDKYTSI